MIVEQIAENIFNKRKRIITKENREPTLAVYIEIDKWHEMMEEILPGKVNSLVFEVYESVGKKIYGHEIHRVLTKGHGIKVLEI